MSEHPDVIAGEQAVTRAYKVTDERYHPYILVQSRNKRVGGSRNNPVYAAVKNPYMTVAGRILMLQDTAKKESTPYDINTDIVSVGEVYSVKAVVTFGQHKASALAQIKFGGDGVDATDPVENADTSALGRALGKLGFGNFGSIASADDMERVMDPETKAVETPPAADQPKPPSERQLTYIRNLCEQAGLTESVTTARLAKVATRDEASALIEQLQGLQNKKQREGDAPAKAKRDAVTALLAYAEEHSMTKRLNELMNGTRLEELTDATAKELHEKLRAEVADHFARADAGDDDWGQLFDQADRAVPDMANPQRRPA